MTLDPNSYVPGLGHEPWAGADGILGDGWTPDGPWITGAAWLSERGSDPIVLRASGPVRWNENDEPLVDASLSGHPTLLCEGQFLAVEAAAATLRMLPISGGTTEPQLAFNEELRRLYGPQVRIAHRSSGREALIAAESLHPNPSRQAAVRLGGLPGHRSLSLPTPEPGADLDVWVSQVEALLEPYPGSGLETSGVGVVLIAPFELDPSFRPIPTEVTRKLTDLAHDHEIIVVADLRRWSPARGGSVNIGFGADVALLDGDVTGGLADVGCLVGDLPDGLDRGSMRPSDAAAGAEVLRQIREEDLCSTARRVSSFFAGELEAFTALDWVHEVSSLGSYVTVATHVAGPMLEWVDRMRVGGVQVEVTSRGVTFALPVDAPLELLLELRGIAMISAGLVLPAEPGPHDPITP
ncbi:MAG: hypothetical protein GY929_14550 [Actinomycetia bacterium]|nr:hypothetical protein [Actinomycetes bacterium]